jgi:methionine-rich copper-binding protein CopC
MQPVKAFDATPPTLPKGTYQVEWRGLAEDGHPMLGTFSFEVTE